MKRRGTWLVVIDKADATGTSTETYSRARVGIESGALTIEHPLGCIVVAPGRWRVAIRLARGVRAVQTA